MNKNWRFHISPPPKKCIPFPPPQKNTSPSPPQLFMFSLHFLNREFRIRIRTQSGAVEKTYSNVGVSITYSNAPDPADPHVKNWRLVNNQSDLSDPDPSGSDSHILFFAYIFQMTGRLQLILWFFSTNFQKQLNFNRIWIHPDPTYLSLTWKYPTLHVIVEYFKDS